jgi:hypothetical protein
MKSIKVRFNLSRGKNYMKWKVEHPSGISEYYEPAEVQLKLYGCTLKNHKKTAEKIFNGAEKTVCAWVLCKTMEIIFNTSPEVQTGESRVSYNPRKQPNWIHSGSVVDGNRYDKIISYGKSLHIS